MLSRPRSPRFAGVLAAVALAGPVRAEVRAPAAPAEKGQPAPAKDSLTFHGITLYGIVDIGVAHIDHGAPPSASYGPGEPFLIQKFNDRESAAIAPNGLSQSKIGLSAVEPLAADLSAVFKLETDFQPTTGRLTDGPRSLVVNNGRPLREYIESGDSSLAGQPFNGAAYAGLQSKAFGALTFGRQESVLSEQLRRYDPQARAEAFSPLGYSGVASGAGDTEEGRLDDALKYELRRGPLRFAVLHQFARAVDLPGGADEVDLGGDIGPLSLDASYSQVADAVSAAPLNALQAATHPGTLAATVSDNATWSLQGLYAFGKAKAYAGYEHIRYANPSRPIAPGVTGIGGYTFSVVNNTAYRRQRVLQISWVGVRYALTPRLDLSGAYYRYDQNSYGAEGCADRRAAACSGAMNAASLVAVYKLTGRFDLYGGLNYSAVAGGLGSGYLNTAAFGQMGGVRFSF